MRQCHSFPMAALVAALMILSATTASASEPAASAGIRYLALVNRAHDSIDRLEVAEPGSGAFQEVALDKVRGGGDSSTVELRGNGCRYDVRFTFHTGQRMVYENVDVCRLQALRVQPPPREPLDLRQATTP
ncbi:hypothetical protein ACWKWK_18570 [Pseudoxanthomonas beigongshangi]